MVPLPRRPPPPPPSFLGSTGFVTGEAGSLECGCLGYSPKGDPGTSESPAGCKAVGTAEALRQPREGQGCWRPRVSRIVQAVSPSGIQP